MARQSSIRSARGVSEEFTGFVLLPDAPRPLAQDRQWEPEALDRLARSVKRLSLRIQYRRQRDATHVASVAPSSPDSSHVTQTPLSDPGDAVVDERDAQPARSAEPGIDP